jgi:hypothetical protein
MEPVLTKSANSPAAAATAFEGHPFLPVGDDEAESTLRDRRDESRPAAGPKSFVKTFTIGSTF